MSCKAARSAERQGLMKGLANLLQAQVRAEGPEPAVGMKAAGRPRFPAGLSDCPSGRPRRKRAWSDPTLLSRPCWLRIPHRTGASSSPRRRPAPGRRPGRTLWVWARTWAQLVLPHRQFVARGTAPGTAAKSPRSSFPPTLAAFHCSPHRFMTPSAFAGDPTTSEP